MMEPSTKKMKLEEEEETDTTGWFDLPFELRIMIIELMRYRTIYKFAQCSKLCYEEAISSKNYCTRISILEEKHELWKILPVYRIEFGYNMWTFQFDNDYQGGTTVKYKADKRCKWEKEEEGNLFVVMAKYANEYLGKFGKNLTEFKMNLNCKARSNFIRAVKLRDMKKLKYFEITEVPRQVCLMKFQFVDFDLIKRVKTKLNLPATSLSFDQLVQLNATTIHIYVMDLTAKEINQYIKYWRDGELNPNLEFITIRGGYSEKNAKRRIVEVDKDGLEFETCDISNYKIRSKVQKDKYALFWFDDMQFMMHVRIG
ncbi:unnamed protein product [Caenorhabditis angaria]|uniref:Sdz-33 F-box domain-containing protein n=1 Tax=Caenorhabditis angaria TaxID=860376 RepID=A0A9P1I6E3_9PELO|nr:unnamed protein product [Caenorhabditis angaria]